MNNEDLGCEFRKQFLGGLRRLIRKDKLRLEEAHAKLGDPTEWETWLRELESTAWNVFVQGPPHGRSNPTHVLKYLARYLSGGPIADSRLISNQQQKVTFWARSGRPKAAKDKSPGNQPEPVTLPGTEFVRRWSMHILPKGYTRSRSYGGFHGSKRANYLTHCQQLLKLDQEDEPNRAELSEVPDPSLPKCSRCQVEMNCIASQARPSWREVFTISVYREPVYCPMLHLAAPQAHAIEGYG